MFVRVRVRVRVCVCVRVRVCVRVFVCSCVCMCVCMYVCTMYMCKLKCVHTFSATRDKKAEDESDTSTDEPLDLKSMMIARAQEFEQLADMCLHSKKYVIFCILSSCMSCKNVCLSVRELTLANGCDAWLALFDVFLKTLAASL